MGRVVDELARVLAVEWDLARGCCPTCLGQSPWRRGLPPTSALLVGHKPDCVVARRVRALGGKAEIEGKPGRWVSVLAGG